MRVAAAALLCIVACTRSDIAFAQTADERVQELERIVQELERRIAALEAELAKPPENTIPRDRQNWRQLEIGMREEEVENLLGAPDRVDANPAFVRWNYDRAYVEFDTRSEVVQGWREP